jgi:hypothetical protein
MYFKIFGPIKHAMKTVTVTFYININPSKWAQEEIGKVTLKKMLLLKKIVKHYLDIF